MPPSDGVCAAVGKDLIGGVPYIDGKDNNCNWFETPNNGALAVSRLVHHQSNPPRLDGRAFVVGGNNSITSSTRRVPDPTPLSLYRSLDIHTTSPRITTSTLSSASTSTENLFIFADNRAILYNYRNNVVVRNYPKCWGSLGTTQTLVCKCYIPLKTSAEVLVCGGAPIGSFTKAKNKTYLSALNTCGRIKITDESPVWAMEQMLGGRVMGIWLSFRLVLRF